MKATGIVRRIDELGRVVLAKEVRRTFGVEEGSKLEMTVDNNGLYIRKHVSGAGFVRQLDTLGRVVIAKEIRHNMGWDTGTPLELFVDDETLILRKYAPGCTLCGEVSDSYKQVAGKNICSSCVSTIKSAG